MRTFSSPTRTSSRRNSPKGYRVVRILGIAVCGFVLLAYGRGGASAAASILFTPIVSTKTWFLESSGRLPSYLRTQHALISEIQSLEKQLRERDADAFTIKQLEEENESFGELLGLKDDLRIIAGVLARPNQTPYDTFLIDGGARDGILDGATVYIEGNIAVGIVARAYPDSSLVRLVSSPGVQSTAYIFGPNIFTQAEGVGGGVLRVAVPQGIPLAVGNLVVLPGIGAGAYGEVVDVETVESNPEQYGYVTTPVPLSSVRFVSVAKEAATSISYQSALDTIKTATTTLFNVTIPNEVLVGTTTAATTTATSSPIEQ